MPTASMIVDEAKRRLYGMHHDTIADMTEIDHWLSRQGVTLQPETAYSDILEVIRPTPRLRRTFLEPFFQGRSPSPAHWALAKIVQAGVITSIYTTNFDNLIEQSVGQLVPLRVVSYDEQVTGFGEFEHQPTLYKLHGDYLFDRIANTQSELQHLGASQAAKLQAACARGGLIVVGYAGRDRSVMEVLRAAALADIPLGLFWLIQRDRPVEPLVKELLEASPSCYLSRIDGFDDFIARVNEAVTRRHSTIRVERSLIDNREPFVAHTDGVKALMMNVREALVDAASAVVCISGLPGVGKTATARRITTSLRPPFFAYVVISGKDRRLALSDVVDECHLQLPIKRVMLDNADTGFDHLMRYLSSTPVLLLLDNIDGPDGSLITFLERLPSPSKALVTIRDAREIRAQIPHIWEVEHTGLTKDEMAELLQLWIKRSPVLSRKIRGATSGDIERLLIASKGWPEAMVMLLSTLANSLLHVGDLDERVQENVYNFILGGLYTTLSRTARVCFVWTGSFPATFTVDGLAAVSRIRRQSVSMAMTDLLDAHLIKELFAGQYACAHPIVREFVTQKARRHRSAAARALAVEKHLESWAHTFGGQPTSDWSNFLQLDREFENLRAYMESAFENGRFTIVTRTYRRLFSYIVERGYWTFTESWCERMTQQNLHRRELPDWLIWWSWIKYYLRRDYVQSAALAERAMSLEPRENRQRFEAHRRALVAHGQLGNLAEVTIHIRAASEVCQRCWNSDSDQAIDLLNSEGAAWLAVGRLRNDNAMVEQAIGIFERAERVARRKSNPNTREIGIAMLGQANSLSVLGQDEAALGLAQSSLAYAWRVSWLRGIAEANELVADLAERLGQTALSRSARDVAERMGSQLRSAPIRAGGEATA